MDCRRWARPTACCNERRSDAERAHQNQSRINGRGSTSWRRLVATAVSGRIMRQVGLNRESAAVVKRFVSPHTSLGALDAESAAALIAAASDITLVLDAAGVVRDFVLQSEELARDLADGESWLGRPVAATVAPDSRPKIEALLRDAATSAETRWRHINHLAADGRSVPVLYCCVQLGAEGGLVAFGRDLRLMSALQQRLVDAQQNMERDYSRLRDVEMRYRLLFQLSSEAVLILEAGRHRVVRGQPGGAHDAGRRGRRTGRAGPRADVRRPTACERVQAHLDAVRAGARADRCHRADHDRAGRRAGARSWSRPACSARTARRSSWCGVEPPNSTAAAAPIPDVKTKLLRAVESAPDGFVVTDEARRGAHRQRRLPRDGAAAERGPRPRPFARQLGGRVGRRHQRADGQFAPARRRAVLHHHAARRRRRQRAGGDLRGRGPQWRAPVLRLRHPQCRAALARRSRPRRARCRARSSN